MLRGIKMLGIIYTANVDKTLGHSEKRGTTFLKARGSGEPCGWDQKGAGGSTGNALTASVVSIT